MTSNMDTSSSSLRRMVTAFFDSRNDAENAIERLVSKPLASCRSNLGERQSLSHRIWPSGAAQLIPTKIIGGTEAKETSADQ